MNNLGIHERLKEARKKLNLNQLLIATDLGIQQKTISEIENGKILNIPNTYIYYFYTKGVSLNWLYDAVEPMLIEEISTINAAENKRMTQSLGSLIENLNPTENLLVEPQEVTGQESANAKNTDMFERLIESKDMTIRSLLTYIQSVENNLEFIKSLLLQKK